MDLFANYKRKQNNISQISYDILYNITVRYNQKLWNIDLMSYFVIITDGKT